MLLVLRHLAPISAVCVLIIVSSLPVQQSIFSSSRLCWFTTVTCTQDISSHTAVALPRLVALQPAALSGFGCRTTLWGKQACTRSCLPTLTCSSTSECGDWTSLCVQRSSRTLTASRAHWPPPSPPSDCQSSMYHSPHGGQQVDCDVIWEFVSEESFCTTSHSHRLKAVLSRYLKQRRRLSIPKITDLQDFHWNIFAHVTYFGLVQPILL